MTRMEASEAKSFFSAENEGFYIFSTAYATHLEWVADPWVWLGFDPEPKRRGAMFGTAIGASVAASLVSI